MIDSLDQYRTMPDNLVDSMAKLAILFPGKEKKSNSGGLNPDSPLTPNREIVPNAICDIATGILEQQTMPIRGRDEVIMDAARIAAGKLYEQKSCELATEIKAAYKLLIAK